MYAFKPEIAYNNIRAHWFSWTSCNGIFDWNEKDGKALPKVPRTIANIPIIAKYSHDICAFAIGAQRERESAENIPPIKTIIRPVSSTL